jgi:hypothetical protein
MEGGLEGVAAVHAQLQHRLNHVVARDIIAQSP